MHLLDVWSMCPASENRPVFSTRMSNPGQGAEPTAAVLLVTVQQVWTHPVASREPICHQAQVTHVQTP